MSGHGMHVCLALVVLEVAVVVGLDWIALSGGICVAVIWGDSCGVLVTSLLLEEIVVIPVLLSCKRVKELLKLIDARQRIIRTSNDISIASIVYLE